jgi:hypothetical protein
MCGPLEENLNDPTTLSAMGHALGCDTPVLEASLRRHEILRGFDVNQNHQVGHQATDLPSPMCDQTRLSAHSSAGFFVRRSLECRRIITRTGSSILKKRYRGFDTAFNSPITRFQSCNSGCASSSQNIISYVSFPSKNFAVVGIGTCPQ